jgi:hypothetical protein
MKGLNIRRLLRRAALWDTWLRRHAAALGPTKALALRGQFALNRAVYRHALSRPDVKGTGLSDPGCNSIRDKGTADVQR